MAYDVSGLTNYTKENGTELIFATVSEGQTLSLIPNIQTGIKSAEKIQLLNISGVWQADTSCGFNASGTTTITNRTITVGKIKVDLEWCEKDLEAKATQQKLRAGSKYESLAFESEFVAKLQNNDKVYVEQAIWNGSTGSSDAYLNKFDGFRTIIGAASGVIACSSSGVTAWSETNARTVSKSLGAAVAASASWMLTKSDVVAFIGTAELVTLRQKYITDNMYHIMGTENTLYVEGTTIPYVGVDGLSGKKEIYIMEKENMYVGTDLENEEEQYEFWYSQDDRVIRYNKSWKMGVQVAFPDRIVKYISA